MPDERVASGPCLEPEVLAAYVERTLTPEERVSVDAHLAACEDCYALLTEVMRTSDEMSAVAEREVREAAEASKVLRPAFGRRRGWLIVGSAVAAAAAMVLALRLQPAWLGGGDAPAIARLAEAVGEQPYLSARLTGDFSYRPGDLRTRSGGNDVAQNLSLLAVAGELQKSVQTHPSVDNLHAWGVAQLLLGRFDEAISSLESAASLRPDDARIQTDLSAASISRAQATGRSDDWPRALAFAERAVRLAPSTSEAVFNRALALTQLKLRSEAQNAWQAYLALDDTSAWAAEARRHLDGLAQPSRGSRWPDDRTRLLLAASRGDDAVVQTLVSTYHEQIRALVEDELLPGWGRLWLAHHDTADATLAQLEVISRALAATDSLLADAVSHVRASVQDGPRANRIAEGVAAYGQARQLYESNRIAESARSFARARLMLSDANAMSLWCDLHLAIADYYAGNIVRTIDTTTALADTARRHGYHALRGRALWMTGLSETVRANYAGQLAAYEQALQTFESLGEHENAAAVHNLLAGTYQYLGDQRRVWTHIVLALDAMNPLTLPRRYHTQLVSTATRALKAGLPEVALHAANEALAFAPSWQAPEAFVEAHRHRALSLAALGDSASAVVAANAAHERVAAIPDPMIRRRLEAELAAMEAETLAASNPARALQASETAKEFFTRTSLFLRVPRLLLAQGRARQQLGDTSAAVTSFEEGIARLEQEHASVPADEITRISHADEVWSMYRELFALLLESGASDERLLELAERGRARSLAERARVTTSTRWVTELQQAIGPDRAVVYFVQLPRETIGWTITAHHVRRVRMPVAAVNIDRDIVDMSDALAAGFAASAWIARSETLHARLVAPLGLSSLAVRQIVIVPDGGLVRLAFAALREPTTGTFLIEQFALSVAPSAGFLLATLRNHRPLDASSRVLAIASGQRVPGAGLPALPGAVEEVQTIARAFPNTVVVSENAATWANVERHVAGADVMHFAGHTVANREYPALSRFYLSDAAGGAHAVFARDLAKLRLARLSLVMLASCSSLDGSISRSEGLVGLARAFLAEGVNAVIASRWDVADTTTSAFVERLYPRLAVDPPAIALAEAARGFIREGRDPGWAAWVLIGG